MRMGAGDARATAASRGAPSPIIHQQRPISETTRDGAASLQGRISNHQGTRRPGDAWPTAATCLQYQSIRPFRRRQSGRSSKIPFWKRRALPRSVYPYLKITPQVSCYTLKHYSASARVFERVLGLWFRSIYRGADIRMDAGRTQPAGFPPSRE